MKGGEKSICRVRPMASNEGAAASNPMGVTLQFDDARDIGAHPLRPPHSHRHPPVTSQAPTMPLSPRPAPLRMIGNGQLFPRAATRSFGRCSI